MGNDFYPPTPCPKTQYTYKITSKAPELLSSLPLQDIFTVTDSAQYPGRLTVSEQISVWWILTSIEIDRVTFLSPRRYTMNSRATKLPCHLPNLAGEYWNPYLASSERSLLSVPLDLSTILHLAFALTEGRIPALLYRLCLFLSVDVFHLYDSMYKSSKDKKKWKNWSHKVDQNLDSKVSVRCN